MEGDGLGPSRRGMLTTSLTQSNQSNMLDSDPIELTKTIQRVRRAMPRNPDVMAICDAAEKSLIVKSETDANPKFDRGAYQREYMRKRRAKS